MLIANRWFLRSLLICIHALGVFGILASSSGGSGGNAGGFACGLSVQGIAPVGDGTVWVGVFAKTNTGTEDRVVLLDTDGSELISYFIGAGGSENAIRAVARAVDGSNDIYIGGDFSGGILRLDDNGMLDVGFSVGTGFNGRVTSIVPLASGEVYVGGYFTEFGSAPINPVSGLVRLNVDGSWDNLEFVTTGVTNVESVALATDGLLAGFVYSGGSGLSPLARWNTGGGLDINFISALDPVLSVIAAEDTSGDIYVGGSFTNSIVRLTDTGTTEPGFAVGTGFDDDVLSIDLAVTGGIYVGGSFTTYNADNSNGIVRIDSDGTRDGAFMVGSGFTDLDGIFPSSKVVNVVEDVSLDVFVGGGFTQYNGIASNGIVRLDPDGTLDAAFDVSITIDGEVCDSQTIPDQP
ncbi:MAG: delta-60 repeat domain-containing protein [Gammaproteobacteria bacterium]|nr:delta-60 repeat domain-containing protein [Gammaproteobacteria bacterium]